MSSLPDPKSQPLHRPSTASTPAAESEARFALRPIGQRASLAPRKWVVDGLIAEESLVVIYGKPGVGKSFLALDLACSVAAGRLWMGRATSSGLAIYVAGEGREGLRYRFACWEDLHGPAKGKVFEPDTGDFRFSRAADMDALIERIIERLSESAVPVKIIVIDTLSDAIPGEDENTQAVMSLVVANCSRIQSETGAAIALIHHPNKSSPDELRGNTVLQGRADALLLVKKDRDNTCSMLVKKQRDGKDGGVYHFRLKPMTFQLDGGKTETSCVVVFEEDIAADSSTNVDVSAHKPSSANDLHELLRDMAPAGALYKKSDGDTDFRVLVADARKEAFSRLYSSSPTDEAKRKRFERDLHILQMQKIVFRDGKDILVPFQEDEVGECSGEAA